MTTPNSPSPAMPASVPTAPFIMLDTHQTLALLLESTWELGMSTVVLGPLGIGKTYSVKAQLNQLAAQRNASVAAGTTPRQRSVFVDQTPESSEKALLVGLYAELSGSSSGLNAVKAQSVKQLTQRVVEHLAQQHVRVIAFDEAQGLSPAQLNTLIHLPDHMEAGHSLGLVLLGPPELRHKVRATGQTGQRGTFEHDMLPLQRADLDKVLPMLSPSLRVLQQRKQWTAPDKTGQTWKLLCDDIYGRCDGTWRPVNNVVRLTESLVVKGSTPEEAIYTALTMLVSANQGRR